MDTYLSSFQWNKVKFRADKPISELISSLDKEISSVDNDIKSKFNQYNSTKTSLASAKRSQTGNLSQKSLTSVVNPKNLLSPDASEYLQQHLIAVPNAQVREYLQTYESLVEHWVGPRSSVELAKDDEFTLFAVTVFKKYSAEFVHKCREKRWTPRDWKFKEGGREAEQAEADKLEKEERRVWGEALRLGRTGYSDAVMAWVHVLVLRVFVETVLRYGLPLSFVCGLVKVCASWLSNQMDTDFITDDAQARSKGQGKAGRQLFTSCRQRTRTRQEGQAGQGGQQRVASRGPRHGGLQRIRLLPVRDVIDSYPNAQRSRGPEFSHRSQCSPFVYPSLRPCLSSPCSSRYLTMMATASSTLVFSLWMWISGFSGSS